MAAWSVVNPIVAQGSQQSWFPLECGVWLERVVGDLFLASAVEDFVVPSWSTKVWGDRFCSVFFLELANVLHTYCTM